MAIETRERYCPICGRLATDPALNCFGEWACSEAHADEYVKEVRAQKIQAAATPASERTPQRPPRHKCAGAGAEVRTRHDYGRRRLAIRGV